MGRTIKRLTTAQNPGLSWEKHCYEVVSEHEYSTRIGTLFGDHVLKDAHFGFLRQDFDSVPETLFRILPVGWSLEAVRLVTDYCRSLGEEPRLLVFKPQSSVLEKRVRQRWGSADIPQQLDLAASFYDSLSAETTIIDSSTTIEDLSERLLVALRDIITVADGYDVVLSYAGPQIKVADAIRTALELYGIKSFVAGADIAPGHDAVYQQNIDRVFGFADVIVTIWSKDYPKREFASHEWCTWVTQAWKQNENKVVFVRVDDTPFPPDMRTVFSVTWNPTQVAAVADAVRSRLESMN